MARAAGAAGMLVTPMADDDPAGLPGGLLREDGSARPAYAAYGHAIDWLGGAGTASRFGDDRGVLVMIEGPEEDVFVMWARTEMPIRFLVTAEAAGEAGRLITRGGERAILSEATVFPAVYAVDAPGAMRDANGFLTVAGSPRMLVVPASDFFRVGYVEIDGERFRIR